MFLRRLAVGDDIEPCRNLILNRPTDDLVGLLP